MPSDNSIDNICKDYITIDNDGNIDFKSPLKDEIERNNISEEEALLILLYHINRVLDGRNYESHFEKISYLIGIVKGAKDKGKDLFKQKTRFNRCYNVEMQIITDYLFVLAQEKDIEDNNISFNQSNSDMKMSKKSIKKYFDDFSTEDLCYILDQDPNLIFSKDKALKNIIIDELLKTSFDVDKLNKNSLDYIKDIITSKNPNNDLTNEEIIKNQNPHIFELKNQFEELHKNQLKNERIQREREKKLKIEKERRIQLEEMCKQLQGEKQRLEIERKKWFNSLSRKLKWKIRRLKNQRRKQLEKLRREEEILKEQEELEKRQRFSNLISKVKLFNNKTILEMALLEDEYSKIYETIIGDSSNLPLDDDNIVLFKKYFSSLDEIKQMVKLINELEEEIAINFNNDLKENGFLNYSKRQKLIEKYESTYNKLPKLNIFSDFLKNKTYHDFKYLNSFKKQYNDLKSYKNLSDENPNEIKKLNEKILDDEINENKEFFKGIDDINKKRAIVIDEKNVKVNAGAGTGKTFTIQNKVNYLIETERALPKEILCLSYTTKGAEDLDRKVNKNRDEEDKVEACTFHEFCRRVAEKCGEDKDRTDRKILKRVVENYTRDLDDEKLTKIVDYFSYYINSPADIEDINNYDELLDYENERDLKTLRKKFYESRADFTMQGETVDSVGELIIANYLFRHDIDYVYGKEYKSNLISTVDRFLYSGNSFLLINLELQNEWFEKFKSEHSWSSYIPDFYIPEKDIYLEHFGIGHKDNEKWLGEDYEPQMKRKIKYHELHQTNLIKTYYCNLEDGILQEKLEEKLRENHVTIGQRNPKEILDVLIKTKKAEDVYNFKKLIMNFINIFEAQNRTKNQFDTFKKINESEIDGYKRNRHKLFLDIVSDIYDSYYKSNEGKRIDNNREISLALELIQKKKYSASYKYILIDEYQDINPIRSLLVQSLQEITGAKLFVVGDDWQSIYKFSGSDLNLFLDFDKYFPNSELIKLKENRRNYEKLINVSSEFIIENKKQEKKELESIESKKSNRNPIEIIDYSVYPRRNKVLKLYAIINRVVHKNPKKNKTRILLLGRYNNDINEFTNNNIIFESIKYSNDIFKIKCLLKPKLDITFMTIHKSKGLQYDEVIILNFKDELNGFPNKIEDDSILRFLKEKDEYPFAEERRLLYVALTRTSNNVYLLAPSQGESSFIKELVEKHKIKRSGIFVGKQIDKDFYKIKSKKPFDYRETDIPCPNCEDGKITVVRNNDKGTQFIRCSNHPVPDPSHYNGGPYRANLEDYIFMEKCPDPNCDGVLVKDFDKEELVCSLNRETGCKQTKKIDIYDYDDY